MRILILDIGNRSTAEIYSHLFPRLSAGTLQKVSVNEQTIGDYLLIPDSYGLNTNTKAFIPHFRVPPKYRGQDAWLEFWRLETSEYYKNSGIKTIGFGDSAFLVYDTMLGGKLNIDTEGEIQLIEDKSIALVDDNNFTSSLHKGYASGSIYEHLDAFLSHLAGHRNKPDEGDELVTVNVGTTPIVPPTVRAKPFN